MPVFLAAYGASAVPWVFRLGFQSAELSLGTRSRNLCLSVFSLGTPLWNKDVLRPIEGDAHLVLRPVSSPAERGCPSARCCRCGAGWPVPCRSTRTRSPCWTRWRAGRYLSPADRRSRSRRGNCGVQRGPSPPSVPATGVQILPHQPLALIGLHGFPLLIFGQRVHFGREIELLTLPHIHESFRPDLEDLLVVRFQDCFFPLPGVLTGQKRRLPVVPADSGLGVGGAKEHALTQMGRGPFAKGRAVNVVLPGEEGAQRFHLRLLQPSPVRRSPRSSTPGASRRRSCPWCRPGSGCPKTTLRPA